MRPWIYPAIALIFNYILYHSFHWGENGGALIVIIIYPILAIAAIALTVIHYVLKAKKIETKYFFWCGILAILSLSYITFPSENTPISVIRKMNKVAKNYRNININHYFSDYRYENYEEIVAAKKKFAHLLPDTSFAVNVYPLHKYGQYIENYGVYFLNGKPYSTNQNLVIEKTDNLNFRFKERYGKDSLVFTANPKEISNVTGRLDSFINYGTGFKKDLSLRAAETQTLIKNQTPDERLFACKIFFWLL